MPETSILELLQKIAIWGVPILFAITLHEAAHGWMARRFGDDTAYMLGRVTLNPIKHIDPIGTLVLPMFLLALGGPVFGWAKPVPVNFRNLSHLRWGPVAVAAAGPAANLLQALLAVLLIDMAVWFGMPVFFAEYLVLVCYAAIVVNIILMILNLLPMLPLDGGRILHALLPPKQAWAFGQTERYGLLILIVLAVTGVLGKILGPPINLALNLLTSLTPLAV